MSINPFRKTAPPTPIPTQPAPPVTANPFPKARKPLPDTTDGKLIEIIRRLGRMERDIIEIRSKIAPRIGTTIEPEINLDHF